jgi:hypothetical protein
MLLLLLLLLLLRERVLVVRSGLGCVRGHPLVVPVLSRRQPWNLPPHSRRCGHARSLLLTSLHPRPNKMDVDSGGRDRGWF